MSIKMLKAFYYRKKVNKYLKNIDLKKILKTFYEKIKKVIDFFDNLLYTSQK